MQLVSPSKRVSAEISEMPELSFPILQDDLFDTSPDGEVLSTNASPETGCNAPITHIGDMNVPMPEINGIRDNTSPKTPPFRTLLPITSADDLGYESVAFEQIPLPDSEDEDDSDIEEECTPVKESNSAYEEKIPLDSEAIPEEMSEVADEEFEEQELSESESIIEMSEVSADSDSDFEYYYESELSDYENFEFEEYFPPFFENDAMCSQLPGLHMNWIRCDISPGILGSSSDVPAGPTAPCLNCQNYFDWKFVYRCGNSKCQLFACRRCCDEFFADTVHLSRKYEGWLNALL